MRTLAFVALCGTLLLAGCGKTALGGVPGATGGRIGGVAGSEIGAGAGGARVGAVSGALQGTAIGQSLTETDRETALRAQYEALEYGRPGRPVEWRSATADIQGRVVVGAITEVNRLDCRDFTHSVFIGGRARVDKGTACRRPDGVWRVVR